ncbi:MAG: signal peptide peptidase SppA [Bryobacteraceae bacterium]|nr:signal peptide peptidase SppA [Bryobacteraceae bacterium]MDW8379282.1 signal peptide peptidase SppA [Bryobacterales bacterium]
MRNWIRKLLAWIGALTVLGAVLLLVAATILRSAKGKVPAVAILELNLETALLEDEPDDPFAKLVSQNTPVLRDIVEALKKAEDDSRVVGLVARLGAASMGMAAIQEIRDAVTSFRSKKKFAVAFAETFGEFGPATASYYLASAFDEIWLQPSGDIGFTGLLLEGMFLRGTFDKLGVVPRMDHRFEYKNAMNMYTEKKFTAAHREALERIRDSFFDQILDGVSKGRKLPVAHVRALVDQAPFFGKEALDAKLVDGLAYRDEVFDRVKKKAPAGAEFLYLSKYLDRVGRPHSSGPVVALIFGVGPVMRGKSEFSPTDGTSTMGSDTITAAFRQAVRDSDVKAILFRVDSPGGSYVASDAIWRETVRAKKAGKPVIVSMSSLAGSGGYFVAMAADKIVAHPGTITGSIGVLGGKLLTSGLWDKVGVSWDEVHVGQNSRMFSTTSDFSKEEWQRFQQWLDRVYDDFTSKVSEGRKLPKEKVLQIARGRIWTGADAKSIGLVDELGGYEVALKHVRRAIQLKDSDKITLRTYPRKRTPIEALAAKLTGDEGESSEAKQAELIVKMAASLQPLTKLLRLLNASQQDVLFMPEVRLR